MSKFIVIMAMAFAFSNIAGADHHRSPLVNIEQAEKVIVKSGMSHHKRLMMLKCLLMVKKHKTADEAIEAMMEKIKDMCKRHKMSDEKCEAMQLRMEKKIHACYALHKFFHTFMNPAETAK